jgi:aspartyl-tRNA synthetase
MIWVDLRDRYGITQLIFDEQSNRQSVLKSKITWKRICIQVKGTVIERASKNPNMATGEIEILVSELTISQCSALIASIYYRRRNRWW